MKRQNFCLLILIIMYLFLVIFLFRLLFCCRIAERDDTKRKNILGQVGIFANDFHTIFIRISSCPYSTQPHTFSSQQNILMWYRFSRRDDDYCIECAQDGIRFKQMRICHMHKGNGKIQFGIYACSPEESSFRAVFTNMQLTECVWKAHSGQQPD